MGGANILNGCNDHEWKTQRCCIVVDKTWFSNPEFCRENKQWYPLSKILAEPATWKFAQENGIDLVVLNRSLVIGPLLRPTLNSTSGTIMEIIKEMKAKNFCLWMLNLVASLTGWRKMKRAIGARSKLGFINGQLKKPEESSPDFERWVKCDYTEFYKFMQEKNARNLAERIGSSSINFAGP